MLNKEQIEQAAEQYAEQENSAWTNDYNGFIAGADFVQQNLQQTACYTALELLAQMLNERQGLAKDGFESFDALMKNGENERALERVIRLIKERQANAV